MCVIITTVFSSVMGPLGCASFLECFHKPPSQFPIFPERRTRTPFPLLVRRRGAVMGPADFEVQVKSDSDCLRA